MSTLVDVAKRANVSIGTASNVLRGTARVSAELRERVVAAIRELEYYPGSVAHDVQIKHTCMLGMILPDITNPFFPEMMRGAEDRASERGYLLVTANTDERIEREKEVVSALRSRHVDGILLAAASGNDTQHIRAAIESGISVVCVDRTAAGINTDAVLLDNVRGSKRCVRHLIRAGIATLQSSQVLSVCKAPVSDIRATRRHCRKLKSRLRLDWSKTEISVKSRATDWARSSQLCVTDHLRSL